MNNRKPRYGPASLIAGRYLVYDVRMGGMGEVYLCVDENTEYPVALKTLRQPFLTVYQTRKRFEEEVANWIALGDHPNIVRCYHLNEIDNQPFLFMERVIGVQEHDSDLRSWLQYGPLDLQTALDFTIDICRGLIHANEKQPGIVHRDLKPENILVNHMHIAQITDFGLAKVVDSLDIETVEQSNLRGHWQNLTAIHGGGSGTPLYRAPEQWLNTATDTRTDIYAAGCIFYELITGQPPYIAQTSDKLRQMHLKVRPPRLGVTTKNRLLRLFRASHCNTMPKIPAISPQALETIDKIITSCLAKRKEDRPTTPTQLLTQLCNLYQALFGLAPQMLPCGDVLMAGEYHNRGVTYFQIKRYQKAIQEFNHALELTPEDPTLFSMRGGTYTEMGQYEEALNDHNCALGLDPTRATYYVNRSYTLGKLGQLEAVLSDLCQALKLDPTNVQALHNRASTYLELGQLQEAFADYERAIQINPMLAKTFYDRGAAYSHLQHDQEAIADYTHAIELNPALTEAYLNRGNAYMRQQQHLHALADLSMAIQINPHIAVAHNSRGCAYDELGEYEKAIKDYTRAIELNPQYMEAYVNRGGTYNHLDRYDEMLADSLRAIEIDVTCSAAYINAGSALANQGYLREAWPYFKQAAHLGNEQGAQYAAQVEQKLTR